MNYTIYVYIRIRKMDILVNAAKASLIAGKPECIAIAEFALVVDAVYRNHRNQEAADKFMQGVVPVALAQPVPAMHVPFNECLQQEDDLMRVSVPVHAAKRHRTDDIPSKSLFCILTPKLLRYIDEDRASNKRFDKTDSYMTIVEKFESFCYRGSVDRIEFPLRKASFCFVTMKTIEDACIVKDKLDNTYWKDGTLVVKFNKFK